MKPRVIIALIVLLLIWSSAFAAIRMVLPSYTPGALALFRFLIASAVLSVYAVIAKTRIPEKRDLPVIAVCGLLGVAVYHVGLNYGELTVKAGIAAFLINSGHVFTALLARIFLKESLRIWGWIGLIVSLAGVVLLSMREGTEISFDPGAIAIVIAALAASIHIVAQKPFLRRYSAVEFTSYVIWAGTPFMLYFTKDMFECISTAPAKVTLAVIYLGIFPAALGYLCWTYILSQMSASVAVSFLYLVPFLATLLAWLALGEELSRLAIIGGTLVLLGVVIVQLFGRPRVQAHPPSSDHR